YVPYVCGTVNKIISNTVAIVIDFFMHDNLHAILIIKHTNQIVVYGRLIAIWLALITVLNNSTVTVISDSAATIASINRRELSNALNKWLKEKNYLIISEIVDVIRFKKIKLTLEKIKGY
ncbi:11493_t:CDS:2, partial [Gigaspora margarita]